MDLILLYKILNNYFSSDIHNFFTHTNAITTGHQFKLFKSFSRLKINVDLINFLTGFSMTGIVYLTMLLMLIQVIVLNHC